LRLFLVDLSQLAANGPTKGRPAIEFIMTPDRWGIGKPSDPKAPTAFPTICKAANLDGRQSPAIPQPWICQTSKKYEKESSEAFLLIPKYKHLSGHGATMIQPERFQSFGGAGTQMRECGVYFKVAFVFPSPLLTHHPTNISQQTSSFRKQDK